MFLPSVTSVGEIIVESFNLYSALSSYDLHLSSESSRLSELINHDYSPQCFVITGLNCAVEQLPAKDQCHNYSPSPPPPWEIAALNCWCSCTQAACQTLVFLHSGSFLRSHPFFLPSRSPFSISIRRHPSAKCVCTFSGYPIITVSALWPTELTAAGAGWRWVLDATTRPSTWCFHMTTSLNIEIINYCKTAIHKQQLCIRHNSPQQAHS